MFHKLIRFLTFRWQPRPIHGKVYKITIGNSVYVGGTTQRAGRRFEQHARDLKAGTHTNFQLQRAYNANPELLKFSVLWRSDATYHTELAMRENQYMKAENQYYLCNMKDAAPHDYTEHPTSEFDRWLYPLCVYLVVAFIVFFVITSMRG